jgi:hypothetical protein
MLYILVIELGEVQFGGATTSLLSLITINIKIDGANPVSLPPKNQNELKTVTFNNVK